MAKTNWAVTRVTAIKVGGCTYEEALPAVKWAGLLWLVHWGPGHEPTWEPWECLALTLQDEWQARPGLLNTYGTVASYAPASSKHHQEAHAGTARVSGRVPTRNCLSLSRTAVTAPARVLRSAGRRPRA